jgi:hypothetical protein
MLNAIAAPSIDHPWNAKQAHTKSCIDVQLIYSITYSETGSGPTLALRCLGWWLTT